jgi:hypothetical protein
MNTKPLALWVQALVFRAAGYSKKSLCLIFVLFSAPQAFAWTDGELLIWISSNRPFHALSGLAKACSIVYFVFAYWALRRRLALNK